MANREGAADNWILLWRTIMNVYRGQRKPHYIREWRKFRGLTQERLAERTTRTPGLISQLENNRVAYTQETIEELAVALNCKPGDLISRNPYAEGDVVQMFEELPDERRNALITILKSWKSAS